MEAGTELLPAAFHHHQPLLCSLGLGHAEEEKAAEEGPHLTAEMKELPGLRDSGRMEGKKPTI